MGGLAICSYTAVNLALHDRLSNKRQTTCSDSSKVAIKLVIQPPDTPDKRSDGSNRKPSTKGERFQRRVYLSSDVLSGPSLVQQVSDFELQPSNLGAEGTSQESKRCIPLSWLLARRRISLLLHVTRSSKTRLTIHREEEPTVKRYECGKTH